MRELLPLSARSGASRGWYLLIRLLGPRFDDLREDWQILDGPQASEMVAAEGGVLLDDIAGAKARTAGPNRRSNWGVPC